MCGECVGRCGGGVQRGVARREEVLYCISELSHSRDFTISGIFQWFMKFLNLIKYKLTRQLIYYQDIIPIRFGFIFIS